MESILSTGDNISARTVYIAGLDKNTVEWHLIQYFINYGEIESLSIHQDEKYYAVAFITFAKKKVAAKVIKIREHTINETLAIASITESYRRPKPSQKHNKDKSNGEQEQADKTYTSILALNDYCLLHICNYLNIIAITELGQTCTQLKSFVEINIYRKYSLLDLDHLPNLPSPTSVSLMEFYTIFTNMRKYIQRFHSSCSIFEPSHEHFFYMIQTNLNHLQELNLTNLKLNEWAHEKFSYSFSQLKVLHLKSCYGLGDVFFQFTPNVVELYLNHIADFLGGGLSHLKLLKKLSIKYCSNICCEHILTYLRYNQQVVRLTLKGYMEPLARLSDFEKVISNLNSLEYLSSNSLQNWPIEKFNCLKSLNTANCKVPSLKALAHKDQLEELDLSYCNKFADNEANLHKYLLSFTKLKVLNLNNTSSIDQELLLKLAEKLDLTSLCCKRVMLTDKATVQLVELSKNLKLFCYSTAKLPVIRNIVELVNNDPNRPKLVFIADIDENEKTNLLNSTDGRGRVQILNTFPEPEDGCHDYNRNVYEDSDYDNLSYMHDDIFPLFEFYDDESDFELERDCYSPDDFDFFYYY